MAMEYFCCYHSYFRKCEKLSDQELGRLFRALLAYSALGERQELTGRESIAFDFIADDIDRAKENYDARRLQQQINGSKGGRPEKPKKPNGFLENPKNPMVFSKTQKTQSKSEYKDKSKDEENTPQTPLLQGGSARLHAVFGEWLTYKQERREAYKPTGLRALETQLLRHVAEYGEEPVIDLIRECMANGWRGIIWDRLQTKKSSPGGTANPFLEILREENALEQEGNRSDHERFEGGVSVVLP